MHKGSLEVNQTLILPDKHNQHWTNIIASTNRLHFMTVQNRAMLYSFGGSGLGGRGGRPYRGGRGGRGGVSLLGGRGGGSGIPDENRVASSKAAAEGNCYSEVSPSSSSISTTCGRELALCCRLGSKGSTTICSVPLISARQKGQPWPSESWKIEEKE